MEINGEFCKFAVGKRTDNIMSGKHIGLFVKKPHS